MKRTFITILTILTLFSCMSCGEEALDYNNPDVRLFVKQLKAGTYNTRNANDIVEVPLFTVKHIPQLLKYTEDMTEIPSFPLPSISSKFGGNARLGECMLWIIESIRVGHYPSLGCKLVRDEAENYEGIYFLMNDEVLKVVALYRDWWEKIENPDQYSSVNYWSYDPLVGSGYRWW